MKIIRYVSYVAIALMMAMTTACGSTDKALDKALEEINKELAGQKMPGIEKMDITDVDGYIVYNYVVDEDQADINAMKESAAEQKEMVKNQVVKAPAQQAFMKLVKLTDRGLKFSYKGNKSGEGYEIIFENEEL